MTKVPIRETGSLGEMGRAVRTDWRRGSGGGGGWEVRREERKRREKRELRMHSLYTVCAELL